MHVSSFHFFNCQPLDYEVIGQIRTTDHVVPDFMDVVSYYWCPVLFSSPPLPVGEEK